MANEIIGCTCNLKVVRYGTQQQVYVSYDKPVPLAGEGYTVIGYDLAPMIQRTRANAGITQQKQGEDKETLYEVDFSDGGNKYFGYNAFYEGIKSEVAYSSSDKFNLNANVIFSHISVMDSEGNTTFLFNQTLNIADLFVYRQPPMTESWGSETEQSFTIPWQDYR